MLWLVTPYKYFTNSVYIQLLDMFRNWTVQSDDFSTPTLLHRGNWWIKTVTYVPRCLQSILMGAGLFRSTANHEYKVDTLSNKQAYMSTKEFIFKLKKGCGRGWQKKFTTAILKSTDEWNAVCVSGVFWNPNQGDAWTLGQSRHFQRVD